MSLIINAILGLIAGVIAKFIMKTGPSSLIFTACLGIAGSIVGTMIGQMLGMYKSHNDAAGIIFSVLGAMLLLWAYGKFFVKK
jgi:uncharacterized membrane protein YeaQ/YmgE (transglycosylase-associated protein family)